MLAVPHILVGGAIGKQIERPYVALPVAFASHYVLDAIPHVDTISAFGFGLLKTSALTLADLFVGFAVLALLISRQKRAIWMFLGALAAMAVDGCVVLSLSLPFPHGIPGVSAICYLHRIAGRSLPNSQWVIGLGTQVLVVAAAILILRKRTASDSRVE